MEKYGPQTPYKWNNHTEYFLSRGHLTPNLAFATPSDRELTFVLTNAAPQWQKFNGGNWAVLERAIKHYAEDVKRGVHVLTGVCKYTLLACSCILRTLLQHDKSSMLEQVILSLFKLKEFRSFNWLRSIGKFVKSTKTFEF